MNTLQQQIDTRLHDVQEVRQAIAEQRDAYLTMRLLAVLGWAGFLLALVCPLVQQ